MYHNSHVYIRQRELELCVRRFSVKFYVILLMVVEEACVPFRTPVSVTVIQGRTICLLRSTKGKQSFSPTKYRVFSEKKEDKKEVLS